MDPGESDQQKELGQLVRQGVQELSEVGHLVKAAGDDPVQDVGGPGYDHDREDPAVHPEVYEPDHDGDQQQPEHAHEIGDGHQLISCEHVVGAFPEGEPVLFACGSFVFLRSFFH